MLQYASFVLYDTMNVQDMPARGFRVHVHNWNILAWAKVV